MQPVGGRSVRWHVAFVAGLALLLGACSDSGGATATTGADREVEVDDDTTAAIGVRRDEADRLGDRGVDEDEVASGQTTSSTTSTSSPPTTASPTTTAAPATTAPPPPPPPTTAPPPPPPPPTTAPPPPPPAGLQYGTRNTGCEQYMYNQINAARANVGRHALAFDTGIQHVALDWSDEMSRTQTLKHNPSYGDQILRYRDYRTAGENVGRGYEQGSLFQAFMNSPGHRANIESGAYSHVTLGCLTDSSGQLWVTQNFWGS